MLLPTGYGPAAREVTNEVADHMHMQYHDPHNMDSARRRLAVSRMVCPPCDDVRLLARSVYDHSRLLGVLDHAGGGAR